MDDRVMLLLWFSQLFNLIFDSFTVLIGRPSFCGLQSNGSSLPDDPGHPKYLGAGLFVQPSYHRADTTTLASARFEHDEWSRYADAILYYADTLSARCADTMTPRRRIGAYRA